MPWTREDGTGCKCWTEGPVATDAIRNKIVAFNVGRLGRWLSSQYFCDFR